MIKFIKIFIQPHNNSFLQCILQDDNEPLSQLKGILPLIIESQFAIKFRPTLVEFLDCKLIYFELNKIRLIKSNYFVKYKRLLEAAAYFCTYCDL